MFEGTVVSINIAPEPKRLCNFAPPSTMRLGPEARLPQLRFDRSLS